MTPTNGHHVRMSTHHNDDPVDALSRVDLNLLVVFDVLARTRSVTRAAQHLGVTQSAVSHTLRRLRELVEDPLLVRSGNGLELTPRAEELQAPLRAALVAVGRALAADVFEPASTRRTFRMTAPDLFDLLVLPALVARLAAEAPRADLAMVPAQPPFERRLEAGDLDLAIVPVGVLAEEHSPSLVRRTILGGTYHCYLRRDHPALADGPLDLDRYVALPHVLVSPTGSGSGPIDRMLAELGLERRIALRVPTFAVAPRVVARTDLVLTAPDRLASTLGELAVVAVPAPLSIPDHGVAMLWHPRVGADPGHRWLRDLVADVAVGR